MLLIQNHYQWACRLNRVIVATTFVLLLLTPRLWQLPFASLSIPLSGVLLMSLITLAANEIIFHACQRLQNDNARFRRFGLILLGIMVAYVWSSALFMHEPSILLLLAFVGLEAQFLRHPLLSAALYGASLLLLSLMSFIPSVNLLPFTQSGDQLVFLATRVAPLLVPLYFLGHILNHVVNLHYHQVETLQSLASTDALTGLINRRQFNARLQSEISRARRHNSPLALALLDIDNFKHLNDYYGHPVGDRILKEIGALIADNVRDSDIAARYGGEEFALILPETPERESTELLERLRQLIAQTVFCLPENPITLSVSIGVAEVNLRASKFSSYELVEKADAALYEAKGTGKNRVIAASQMLTSPLAPSALR